MDLNTRIVLEGEFGFTPMLSMLRIFHYSSSGELNIVIAFRLENLCLCNDFEAIC